MSARDDYPYLAQMASPPGPHSEAVAALNEVDRLRAELDVAQLRSIEARAGTAGVAMSGDFGVVCGKCGGTVYMETCCMSNVELAKVTRVMVDALEGDGSTEYLPDVTRFDAVRWIIETLHARGYEIRKVDA